MKLESTIQGANDYSSISANQLIKIERDKWINEYFDLQNFISANINNKMNLYSFKQFLSELIKRLENLFPEKLVQVETKQTCKSYLDLAKLVLESKEYNDDFIKLIAIIERMLCRTGFYEFYFERYGFIKKNYRFFITKNESYNGFFDSLLSWPITNNYINNMED